MVDDWFCFETGVPFRLVPGVAFLPPRGDLLGEGAGVDDEIGGAFIFRLTIVITETVLLFLLNLLVRH